MRFKGRVFLSEIGSPEHDYSHLLRLFGERVHLGVTLLCMYTLVLMSQSMQTTANNCKSTCIPLTCRCAYT